VAGVVVDIDKILKADYLKIYMMNKRGQVTIFIIIAVILIAAVILYFVLKDSFPPEETLIETSPVINFVQECFDQTLEGTLQNISKQGGYSGYSYLSRETTDSGVNYYLIEKNNYFPSKDFVEHQIEEYFERKFFLCTRHFIDFRDYNIEEGLLETSVNINDEEVILKADYPLTITKSKSTFRTKNFESQVKVRLGIVYDSVSDFINQQKQTDKLCLSCLNLAVENNIYVDMESYYDGTVVFTFRDDSSELNNKPLEWMFAIDY